MDQLIGFWLRIRLVLGREKAIPEPRKKEGEKSYVYLSHR